MASKASKPPVILNVCKLSNEDEEVNSSTGNTPRIRNLSGSGYELSESQKTGGNSSTKKEEFVDWQAYIRNNEGLGKKIFKASSFRRQKGSTLAGNETKSVQFSPVDDQELRTPKVQCDDVDRSKTMDKEELHVAINVLMKRDRGMSRDHRDDVLIQEDSSEESVSTPSS